MAMGIMKFMADLYGGLNLKELECGSCWDRTNDPLIMSQVL